jgi:hypothetical protein
LALVVQGLWEFFESFWVNEGDRSLQNLSFLRMLRVIKMLKLLRVIRLLRMFRELRLILSSVFGCVHSMMWATLLILMLSYMFAIVFVQGATQYLQLSSSVDPEIVADLDMYWNSVGKAIVSLYIACTGGTDWDEIANCLKEVGFFFYTAFCLYIAIYSVVVVNTISSVFFEAMMNNSDKDTLAIIELHMEKREEYIENLQKFFDAIDDNQDGEITLDEFSRHCDTDPHMLSFASSMDLDLADAKEFFQVLSLEGRKPVDLESFMVGCIKLKGKAREMDLMDLVYSHRRAVGRHEAFEKVVIGRLDADLRHLVDSHHDALCKQERFSKAVLLGLERLTAKGFQEVEKDRCIGIGRHCL